MNKYAETKQANLRCIESTVTANNPTKHIRAYVLIYKEKYAQVCVSARVNKISSYIYTYVYICTLRVLLTWVPNFPFRLYEYRRCSVETTTNKERFHKTNC